jgi:dihydroneopterin aldolase
MGAIQAAADDGPDYQRAFLAGVEVDVRCGLHPWERHSERPNRLRIDVELITWTPFDAAAGAPYLDYDRVRDRILTWPDRPHVDLLETLLQELTDLAFEDPVVDACRVRILKPHIFAEAAGAGVEWYRRRPR